MPNPIYLIFPIILFVFWTSYALSLLVRGLREGKVMRRNMMSSPFKYIPGKVFTRAENPAAFWAFVGLYFFLVICGITVIIFFLSSIFA